MNSLLALSIGVFLFLGLELLLDLILGDRGKDGQIKAHYSTIKGDGFNIKELEQQVGVIEDMTEKNKEKYRTLSIYASLAGLVFGLLITRGEAIFISLLFASVGLFVPKALKIRDIEKKSDLIANQFRDALQAIKSSLRSGASMNSALVKCPEDIEKIHMHYKDKIILREFLKMRHELLTGVPIDQVLISLRDRMGIEEISDFVNSILILKKKGGNLVEAMDNTISMISDKIALKSEVKVLTAQKKMEANVLNAFPFALLLLLSIFSPAYMKDLYDNIIGQFIVIIGLSLIVINYFVGKKITDISA